MKHILFVEDDLSLINGLSFAIKKEGYKISIARTKKEASELLKNNNFDLLILDVSLPDGSGYDICKEVRKSSTVPIVFLTAKDEETDIIIGLDIGGDDYITKPFKLAVFLSKINALLRRSDYLNSDNSTIYSNGIKVDLLSREVFKNNNKIELTAYEYKLLCTFIKNKNLVLSPQQILEKLWDNDENYINTSAISVYIYRLRLKVEDDISNPTHIITVRGMGYKWNEN